MAVQVRLEEIFAKAGTIDGEEIVGTVATARRRTCGQDRNVEGVKQTFRARQAQAGCINRERRRPESARTKCVGMIGPVA